MLDSFDGIFACVLSDESTGDFVVARDAMGICPLYWGQGKDGSMWFASEMKALIDVCETFEIFPPVRAQRLSSLCRNRHCVARCRSSGSYFQHEWLCILGVSGHTPTASPTTFSGACNSVLTQTHKHTPAVPVFPATVRSPATVHL